MENDTDITRASFNTLVRTYILLYVAAVLLVTVIGIPLMIVWLCGVGQWYSRHYFDKLECVLTERTLRFRKGIIFQVEKTIPLENIQDLTFIEGPLLKYFHLSVLRIETAGHTPKYANSMSLVGIIDAHEFRRKVMQQRHQLIESRQKGQSAKPATGDDKLYDVLVEIRDLLKNKS